MKDFQKFKNLLDELGIKYEVSMHAGEIKELCVLKEYCYKDYKDEVNNSVSIVFAADDSFMYFEGFSWK